MNPNLPAYAVVILVLAVIGSATYLASGGLLPGATVAELLTLVLTAAGITGAIHVASKSTTTTSTPPGPGAG